MRKVERGIDAINRTLFDRISIVTLILDPKTGAIVYGNPAATKFYGYTAEQFRKLNIGEINPQPLSLTLENIRKAFSGEISYYVTRHKTASGNLRDVGIYSGLFDIDDQHLIIAMIHDITLRKQAEDMLRTLSQAVEHSPVSIVITDVKGKIEYVNPKFTSITGYSLEEALGQDPRILKTGGSNREEIRHLWHTILSGQTWRGEFCNRKKNGEIYWESASISPVFDENGKIVQFVAVKEDITEKREAQKQITEALEFTRAILETSPIAILIYRISGQCISANAAAGRLLGADPMRIMAQNFEQITPWKEYGVYDVAKEAIEKGEPVSRELYYVSTYGKALWMNVVCTPFTSGGVQNLLLMFEDISNRKQTESNLQRATEQMESMVRELEERNHKANLLRDMGELLQVCNETPEAFKVINQFGDQLFPSSSGGIYLAGQNPTLVEIVASWGKGLSSEAVFSLEDCWALRRSQVHVIQADAAGLRCQHMPNNNTGSYLDVPMTSSGDLLGLLHIEFSNEKMIDEFCLELAENVSEHLALSLSNIRLRETLRSQSIRDPLTGVFNRRYMEETLEREIPRARRKKSSVGIVMFDIDHFKKFNDQYGHDAGDFVLKSLSQLIQRKIRGEDIVCRFGGEEFVLIMPDTSLDVTYLRAENIRKEVEIMDLTYEKKDLGTITISCGVAIYPDHGENGNFVIQSADAALYRAKNEGRNRVSKAG